MTTMPASPLPGLGETNPLSRRFARGFECPLLRSRARRINLVLVSVVLMGLADLAYTLTYMRGSGMIEANPIARTMVEIGSARQLVLYKLLTLTVCCGAIYFCRRTRQAEFGAWICCLVMLGLTMHWLNYNATMAELTTEFALMAELSQIPETASIASHFVRID